MKAISGYVSALKRSPKEIMSTFKGKNKIKHIAFAAGGALGTYALGGMVTSSLLVPVLSKVPGASNLMSSAMAKRVIGGLVPFTIGFVGSKFLRNADLKKAVMVGGAVASLVELAAPGMIGGLIQRVTASSPVAVPVAAKAGPVNGMAGFGGYVDSPAYQGTGVLDGYVDSPAYQGTGDLGAVDGYVDSPAYQGTGADDDLAGPGDEEMAGVDGYMTEGQKYMDSYLN